MSAYLIVGESDGAAWLLYEVHATFAQAEAAAEAYKARDRSHGGKPYTWVHIIEQAGADVLREWRFDDWQQAWVSVGPAIVVPESDRVTVAELRELQQRAKREAAE